MKKLVFNPYGLIDENATKYKANFHSHSCQNRVMTEQVSITPVDSEGNSVIGDFDPADQEYVELTLEAGAIVYRSEKVVDHNGVTLRDSNPNYSHGQNFPYWIAVNQTNSLNPNSPLGEIHGSDGGFPVDEVVGFYHERNIKILCVAEHDSCQPTFLPVWPWSKFHIDVDELGMLPIPGTEWGVGDVEAHHRMTIFKNLLKESCNITLEESRILQSNELTVGHWAHVGRYLEDEDNLVYSEQYPLQMYIDSFIEHNTMQGLEVFNSSNRHYRDIDVWDDILMELMPMRPVWGFANDDFHGQTVGSEFNTVFMDRFDIGSLAKALARGEFTATTGNSSVEGHQQELHPTLNSVIINEEEGEITLNVSNTNTIEWKYNQQVVGSGTTFKYSNNNDIGAYVRAELFGNSGRTALQPFGFIDFETSEEEQAAIVLAETITRQRGAYPQIFP